MQLVDKPKPSEPPAEPPLSRTWLQRWEPENSEFFESEGKAIAWRTLAVTTFCLTLAFSTWFMVSAIVTKLQGAGFALTTQQLFWLAAMPGLAAGTLRIIHTFLIPIFGTRHTVTASTLLLIIPCIGWGMVVQRPETPYPVLLALAFIAGLGGGNFSSFMPSTSLFFPKKKAGTALAIQAGLGNFGVSLVQFIGPILLGVALVGTPQVINGKSTYLQNLAYVWIPLILVGAVLAWFTLRSVPVKASFREQTDIFKDKHTWLMTSLYIMTFGSFSGFAACFPLLIKQLYGGFEGAPDPLKYAFLGPLVGAGIRVAFGPISDRFGGAKVTMLSGVGLLVCAIGVTTATEPTSLAQLPVFIWWMIGIFLFAGIGNASTFKQMPMIFPPRQAGGVIGWTAAIAAYGPFLFSVLLGVATAATGSPTVFFIGAAAFYAINIGINWWFYTRKNAEKPC
jgi:MFS transporter, NNP family, nitrate/nitrite transporter